MNLTTKLSALRYGFYRDAFIMMVAMTLSNFFNYLYQLLMGRLLTPQEYGELFSLLSLFYIFSVLSNTVNASMTKFTAVYKVNNEYGKIKALLIKATKSLSLLGIGVYVVLILLSPFISSFLHIENRVYVIALFASIPFGLVLPAHQGILRGLQRFGALGVSVSSWALFKLIFGVLLVLLGYGVLGGVLGVFLAHVGAFLITLLFLRDLFGYRDGDNHKVELTDIIKYSVPAFLAIFAYTTMWNIDVILVKHYLSPTEAGNYSAISVLGKIALFAPGAVSMVVFPKAAENHERGEGHFHILLRGLALVSLISGGIVLAYALFPEFIITFIYGEKYLSVAPYLWRYGLAMMFFAMASVTINYMLSINKTKVAWYVLGMLIVEIGVLSITRDILTIINTLIAIGLITVSTLLVSAWRQV